MVRWVRQPINMVSNCDTPMESHKKTEKETTQWENFKAKMVSCVRIKLVNTAQMSEKLGRPSNPLPRNVIISFRLIMQTNLMYHAWKCLPDH